LSSPARTAASAASAADRLSDAVAITAPDDSGRLPVLSRSITLEAPADRVMSAVLTATAHGIHESRIGDRLVTDTVLNPGWTSYEHRLQVQTFDVTDLVRDAATGTERPGDANGPAVEVSATLAGGWWRGPLGWTGTVATYGPDLAYLAALDITFTDGHTQHVATDESWTSILSQVTLGHNYHGQHEDRTLAPTDPEPVRVIDLDHNTLIDQASPLITHHETLHPHKIWTSPAGKTLVDFGQNLVGVCHLTLQGPAGTTVTLRHAEVLEHDELGTRPLRTAQATDRITLAGDDGGEEFFPRFTYHGFRYVEVTGYPGELSTEDIEAVVIGSDLTPTSSFTSSHAGLNQLIHNSIWSQKGNFLAVPTDCPQRDERLGWTGDISAYAPTAAFQYDVSDFLHTWLLDLHAETAANPRHIVPFVVPDFLKLSQVADQADVAGFSDPDGNTPDGWGTPTAIWGDAACWVPQALWNAYGDLDQLRAHYPGMTLHLESVQAALSDTGLWDTGFQFADWLDPDAPPEDAAAAKADKGVVATACLIRSARFTAQAAELLGLSEDAARYQELADRTLAAFTEHYVHDDGTITSDCQTVYALAIAFDLLDAGHRQTAGDRLDTLVHDADFKISTGFAGTPYVTDALTATGHVDTAYRLLLEEGCPSWLYPVSMGATTIWERWDSMLPDGTINPGEMTSFNHYALGAVADWVYRTVLGITPAQPGYQEILIRPVPGPGLDWASGHHDSPVGRIDVDWRIDPTDDTFHLEVTTPDGIPTTIVLPDGTTHHTTGNTHTY
jgi:alpha-L-rhamnosidase